MRRRRGAGNWVAAQHIGGSCASVLPAGVAGLLRARYIARPGRGSRETSMRLPMLLLIAAVLIGETQVKAPT
jgi:hypothetical protein